MLRNKSSREQKFSGTKVPVTLADDSYSPPRSPHPLDIVSYVTVQVAQQILQIHKDHKSRMIH